MTPDQERDFIERQVNAEISRRHFMQWSTKAGISGIAALSLSGGVLAACSSGSKKNTNANAGTSGSSDSSGFGGGGGDTVKVGVIGVFSGVGAFVGRIVNNSLDAAVQQINSTGGIGG